MTNKMHFVPEQVVSATPRTDRERATITFTTREGATVTLYITPAFAEQLYGAAQVAGTTVLPQDAPVRFVNYGDRPPGMPDYVIQADHTLVIDQDEAVAEGTVRHMQCSCGWDDKGAHHMVRSAFRLHVQTRQS